MSPKGSFDLEGAETLIKATRKFKQVPPGGTRIHYDKTGFMRQAFDSEEGVLEAIGGFMEGMPLYDPGAFQVAAPQEPMYPPEELNQRIVTVFFDRRIRGGRNET